MSEQRVIKFDKRAIFIFIAGRMQFAQHERMTADCALPEDNQTASQNVGALNRDRDRCRHVTAGEVIFRPHHDGFAAMYVHGVIRDFAAELGTVILENCRRHGRFLALIDSACRDRYGGTHDVGMAGDSGQRLTNTFKIRD